MYMIFQNLEDCNSRVVCAVLIHKIMKNATQM
jgi:hypothetical protein